MLTAIHTRKPSRQLLRKLLRALNGAAIGAVIGALLGGGLGAVSAFVVDLLLGTPFLNTISNWSNEWRWCALLGAIPAVPAGFLLGTSIVTPDDRRRLLIGVVTGLLVGVAYTWFWSRGVSLPPLVMGAIVISGLVGGLVLTLILTAIRRRWKWWTRWDEEPLRA